jgi:Holliday junction resolvase RusA-like endonuclease
MSLLIVLPLPAKALQPNCTIATYGGRFKKASATKKYRRITCEAVQQEQVEDMPWGRVSVTAEFFHGCKRRRDQDNAMGSLKAAYDGIVDSGLVADDDYEHMERGVPTFSHDKLYPRVELTITKEDE